MSKQDYTFSKQQTRQHLQDIGCEHHMFHAPAADDYWNAPLRVLAVNMESYGYDKSGFVDVDFDCLLEWMYDSGNTGTRTVRYTFALVRTLIDAYVDGAIPSPSNLKMAYKDRKGLESVVKKVAYYNIRPTSNPNKKQDAKSITASGTSTTADFIRVEMVALDPHVIFVSGEPGLAAFNAMWRLTPPLRFRNRYRHSDSLLIQSIKHPAYPDYNEYARIISEVVRSLKTKA